MTTIACNRQTMAADSQISFEDGAKGNIKKLFRVNGDLIGFCGETDDGLAFVDWYKNKTEPARVSKDFEALVLTGKGIFLYYKSLVPIRIESKFHAIGSGRKVALGFMEARSDPKKAVRAAAKHDDGTSSHVRSLQIKKRK